MEKKYKAADQLIIANIELAFLNKEKEKRAAELLVANKELAFQSEEKEKRGEELLAANIELAFQSEEKEKRAAELIVANIELVFQNGEKEKRGAELVLAKKELVFQNKEKEKRDAELILADRELVFQNKEKEKRAAELTIANKELTFQSEEKGKRAAELVVANKELTFQNEEKEKRAAELIIANTELVFQTKEKEKRAAELVLSTLVDLSERKKDEEYVGHLAAIVESSDDAIVSKSLTGVIKSWNKGSAKMFGYTAEEAVGKHISLVIPPEYINEEKTILERIRNNEIIDHYETVRKKKSGEQFYVSLTVSPLKNRAGNIIGVSKIARDITSRKKSEAELIRVNKELAFQNSEREKRAAELIVANKELLFQNEEKEKRAAELIIANKELATENQKKEKRAAELIIANKELAFQNEEKEKRTGELIIANEGLKQFAYVASHDLREPLRAVSNYMQVFEEDYIERLDDNARKYLYSVNNATKKMSQLIKSLLGFSRIGHNKKLTYVDCKELMNVVIADLGIMIKTYNAVIEVTMMPKLNVYETEIRQVFQHLIINAIKFHKKNILPKIQISAEKIDEKWKFSIRDNGIGIAPAHFEKVFDVFQRLNANEVYEGNGIGLANCKKIVQLHQGEIWVESNLEQGTTFHFTIPNLTV